MTTIYREEEIDGVMMKVPYVQDVKNAVVLTKKSRISDILIERVGDSLAEVILNDLESEGLI